MLDEYREREGEDINRGEVVLPKRTLEDVQVGVDAEVSVLRIWEAWVADVGIVELDPRMEWLLSVRLYELGGCVPEEGVLEVDADVEPRAISRLLL